MCVTTNPQILKLDRTLQRLPSGLSVTNAICTSSSYRLLPVLHAAGENLRGVCDLRGAMGCLPDTRWLRLKQKRKKSAAYSPRIQLLYVAPDVFLC